MAIVLEIEGVKLVKGKDSKCFWRKEFSLSQVFDSESDAIDAMDNNKINWRDMRNKDGNAQQ